MYVKTKQAMSPILHWNRQWTLASHKRFLRHLDESEIGAQQSTIHIIEIMVHKKIHLPVCSGTFPALCSFLGSSKHNEVLDSKCQTCNLQLVSGFFVRVCFLYAVFICVCVREQTALLCCVYQRFSGTTNVAATRAARPSTQPTGKLWIGWSCSAGSLKNTVACDAALEAGIQPRLKLYKWSWPHWFKV